MMFKPKILLTLLLILMLAGTLAACVNDGDSEAEPLKITAAFVVPHGADIPDQILTGNGKITRPPDPENENYDFGGWYTDELHGKPWNFDDNVYSDADYNKLISDGVKNSVITLYAKMTLKELPEKTYTVTLETNGGSAIGPISDIKHGNRADIPSTEKQGFDFVGWYYDDGFRFSYFEEDGITEDITLYARWIQEAKGLIYRPDYNSPVFSYIVEGHNGADKTGENIIIPDTYDGTPVIGVSANAFKDCQWLKSVKFPRHAINIGHSAFYNTGISEVEIYGGKAETSAFSKCANLTKASFGIEFKALGTFAFTDCAKLKEISFAAGAATEIGQYVFHGTAIDTIAFSNAIYKVSADAFDDTPWYLSQVETRGKLIYIGKVALKYTHPRSGAFDIALAPGTLGIADGCFNSSEISSIKNTDKLKYIGALSFVNCFSLKFFYFPEGLLEIGNMAFMGTKLSEIELPESLERLGQQVFADCKLVEKVKIPGKITFLPYNLFGNCELLSEVIIPPSVTVIGDRAFINTALKDVSLPDGLKTIGSWAFGGCKALESIIISETVETIGSCAFYDCESLNEINLPSSLTQIGGNAFADCVKLTEIFIPASVTFIGLGFIGGCTGITEINVAPGNKDYKSAGGNLYDLSGKVLIQFAPNKGGSITLTDGLESIGNGAFMNNLQITYVYIPDSVLSVGEAAFYGCKNLAEVRLPANLTVIKSSAFALTGLMSVAIPGSVTAIENNAFGNCENLTLVTIPASVTEIDIFAFSLSKNLAAINVEAGNKVYSSAGGILFNKSGTTLLRAPYGFTGNNGSYTVPSGVKKIDECAFYGSALTEVILPETVEIIGKQAFDFSYIHSLTLPSSVKSLDVYALYNIYEVTILAETPPEVYEHGFVFAGGVQIFVPQNLLAVYQNTPGWEIYNISATGA